MARSSPLAELHHHAGAALAVYGPADHAQGPVEVVETYGELELEYAALRKHCIVIDQPHRGLIEVAGSLGDRTDFLNRMLTQELKDAAPGDVRHSFWLNRKGRIDADLRVVTLQGRTLLECDTHAAARAHAGLSAFVFAEDVTFTDITQPTHSLALHGPRSLDLIAAAAERPTTDAPALADRRAFELLIAGAPVVAFRDDTAGVPGIELLVPASAAVAVFQRLLAVGHDAAHDDHGPGAALRRASTPAATLAASLRLRPAGWHAWNIARIEAGTPMYNVDFGPESLPAETGVLHDRVCFTKGCYLGQEIVARMHARGSPKQTLVGIAFEQSSDGPGAAQPSTGAGLRAASADPAAAIEAVGVVTSSTLAPMLSSAPVAFAQVRFAHSTPGTRLVADVAGREVVGVVQPTLEFWPATA